MPAVSEQTKKDYITRSIGWEAMYTQLAEEATELAQAALKVARIMHGTNPTTISLIEAKDMVREEFTDVVQCATYLELGADYEQIKHKEERWANRIANAQTRKY